MRHKGDPPMIRRRRSRGETLKTLFVKVAPEVPEMEQNSEARKKAATSKNNAILTIQLLH